MNLVAERVNEIVVLPVSYILQKVVPKQVEQIDPKVYRHVKYHKEGQKWIHRAGVLLSHVKDKH